VRRSTDAVPLPLSCQGTWEVAGDARGGTIDVSIVAGGANNGSDRWRFDLDFGKGERQWVVPEQARGWQDWWKRRSKKGKSPTPVQRRKGNRSLTRSERRKWRLGKSLKRQGGSRRKKKKRYDKPTLGVQRVEGGKRPLKKKKRGRLNPPSYVNGDVP